MVSAYRCDGRTKPKDTPALVGQVLHQHGNEPAASTEFHYWSIIGKLNYLQKSTRPDLAFAVHNAARHSANSRELHIKAVHQICQYLAGTADKGMTCKVKKQGFRVYVNANNTAKDDPRTAHSRTGFVITYANCPILWLSKLQTQKALSTTEAKYLALSEALWHTIPLLELTKEVIAQNILHIDTEAQMICTLFEDNTGTAKLACIPKI